jgi:hypothetical protein
MLCPVGRYQLPTGKEVPELEPTDATLTLVAPSAAGTPPQKRRAALLKALSFQAVYPDGNEGSCQYTRYGPAWHLFEYAHPAGPLPRQYSTERIANEAEAVEAKGKELAPKAFSEAIELERRDRFARATWPYGQKPDPSLYVLSPKDAKALGGKYALCLPLPSGKLVRSSAVFATLDEANHAFSEVGDRRLIVACCCRLNRRWERPRLGAKGGTP